MTRCIVLFGNHPPPFGGVPSHIEYLAQYLVERGWDVHVISMTGAAAEPRARGGYTIHRPSTATRFLALARYMSRTPITAGRRLWRARRLAIEAPRLFFSCLSLAAVVNRIASRNSAGIISAYHLFSAGLASAWAAEDLELPLVTTIFGEVYANRAFHWARRHEIQYIARISRRMLSCSHHCARSLEAIGIPVPAEAVHYGIDTDRFSPTNDGSVIRRRLGIGPDDLVVLYVARLVREMGLHVLLAAAPRVLAAIPRLRIVIAGASGDLRQAAEVLATKYPENLIVATDVAFADLPAFYAAATIAVSPSINERACLGLAIAEAMASGKAVIATAVGGGPELVANGANGILVPPERPDALAEAILDLLSEPERAVAMGKAGRVVATSQFDKNVTNLQMEAIFLECLK